MSDDEQILRDCPACGERGPKTERVGTRECKTRRCRVHFYQQARAQDVIE